MQTVEKNKIKALLQNTFHDYRENIIDGTEVHVRLIDFLKIEEFQKVSFLKRIIEELDYFEIEKTLQFKFQQLVELCKGQYLNFMAFEDYMPDAFSFRNFIEKIIEIHRVPKMEYEKVGDKEKFWQLVAVIEKLIEK